MSSDFPLPDTDWEPTREFWRAAQRGELAIPRCEACGRYVWYPAERCSGCNETRFRWSVVSGRGTLFSWALVHRALVKPFVSKVPFVTGLVALDEDPTVRIVTNVVDCNADALRMDMPMCVVFRPLSFPDTSREVVAPMFAPADPPAGA